ncbi:hypothetical protein MRB53_038678 [Persea americana]|nr:hypothetical protein MRB53_038678 [Persea americana]
MASIISWHSSGDVVESYRLRFGSLLNAVGLKIYLKPKYRLENLTYPPQKQLFTESPLVHFLPPVWSAPPSSTMRSTPSTTPRKSGKRQVLIRPSSKVIVKFLSVMQKHGYIGEFEEVDDHRNGKIVIQLNGRLNKTGVISPRYNVQLKDMEKWVVQLLPSRQFGYIVLTTSAGHHGPRGGQEKTRQWKNHWLLLLIPPMWRRSYSMLML